MHKYLFTSDSCRMHSLNSLYFVYLYCNSYILYSLYNYLCTVCAYDFYFISRLQNSLNWTCLQWGKKSFIADLMYRHNPNWLFFPQPLNTCFFMITNNWMSLHWVLSSFHIQASFSFSSSVIHDLPKPPPTYFHILLTAILLNPFSAVTVLNWSWHFLASFMALLQYKNMPGVLCLSD